MEWISNDPRLGQALIGCYLKLRLFEVGNVYMSVHGIEDVDQPSLPGHLLEVFGNG